MFGRTNFVKMRNNQKTSDYLAIFKDHLFPFADKNMPVTWVYQ